MALKIFFSVHEEGSGRKFDDKGEGQRESIRKWSGNAIVGKPIPAGKPFLVLVITEFIKQKIKKKERSSPFLWSGPPSRHFPAYAAAAEE